MPALIISPDVQRLIERAIAKARHRVRPLSETKRLGARYKDETILTLDKRGPEAVPGRSYAVRIPVGYIAAISFEQQPAGLCRHLSVSVERGGKLPSMPAFGMIAQAFGIDTSTPGVMSRIWLEEFKKGQFAVNIVSLDVELQPPTTTTIQ